MELAWPGREAAAACRHVRTRPGPAAPQNFRAADLGGRLPAAPPMPLRAFPRIRCRSSRGQQIVIEPRAPADHRQAAARRPTATCCSFIAGFNAWPGRRELTASVFAHWAIGGRCARSPPPDLAEATASDEGWRPRSPTGVARASPRRDVRPDGDQTLAGGAGWSRAMPISSPSAPRRPTAGQGRPAQGSRRSSKNRFAGLQAAWSWPADPAHHADTGQGRYQTLDPKAKRPRRCRSRLPSPHPDQHATAFASCVIRTTYPGAQRRPQFENRPNRTTATQ